MRTPIHPGEILCQELEDTGLSAKKLADVIEVPPNRLYQLIAGERLRSNALRRADSP
jgi:plasmid maintenance system antidote protein VapI